MSLNEREISSSEAERARVPISNELRVLTENIKRLGFRPNNKTFDGFRAEALMREGPVDC